MKNIKDIMGEMENLCEQENNKLHSAIDYCANGVEPLPTCEPCPDNNEADFCCVITVPEGFTFSGDEGDITVGFATKCCTLVPGDECCQVVCGCNLKLFKFSVNACIDVRVAIKVTDDFDNETFLCCEDCICFDGHGISCNPVSGNCEGLEFSIAEKFANEIGTACSTSTIYEIRGTITLGCSDSDCQPLPTLPPQ